MYALEHRTLNWVERDKSHAVKFSYLIDKKAKEQRGRVDFLHSQIWNKDHYSLIHASIHSSFYPVLVCAYYVQSSALYPGTTAVTNTDHRPCSHWKHWTGEIPNPVSFYCPMLPIFKTAWFHISYQECQPNKATQCQTQSFCHWVSTEGNNLSKQSELVLSAETSFRGHFSSTAQRCLGVPCQFFTALLSYQIPQTWRNTIFLSHKRLQSSWEMLSFVSGSYPQLKDGDGRGYGSVSVFMRFQHGKSCIQDPDSGALLWNVFPCPKEIPPPHLTEAPHQ